MGRDGWLISDNVIENGWIKILPKQKGSHYVWRNSAIPAGTRQGLLHFFYYVFPLLVAVLLIVIYSSYLSM